MDFRILGPLLAGAALACSAAAPAADPPASRLTFATWIAYGGGTGALSSPAALCETSPSGGTPVRLSDRIGSLSDPAWTRDGTRLAFTGYDTTLRSVVLQVTSGDRWQPRTVVRGPIREPAWSPDAQRLAFSVDGDGVWVTAADGSGRRTVADDGGSPSWSPDGARVAFAAHGGVWTVDSGGGAAVQVTTPGLEPAWSPDGRSIAFVAPGGGSNPLLRQDELFVVAPDGQGRRQVTMLAEPTTAGPLETRLSRPAWSPDGAAIALARTVVFKGLKGESVESADLVLVDPVSGAVSNVLRLDRFGNPAWRVASPNAADAAATRPCTIHRSAGRVIRGTAYDDLILATDRPERIAGRAGNDWIHAAGGRDTVDPGPGRDEVWTGRGSDRISVRDRAVDLVHCGEAQSDVGTADRADRLLGSCRRVQRH